MKINRLFNITVLLGICLLCCNCSSQLPARLNREAQSSDVEMELRQLHAEQRFSSITFTGNNFSDCLDEWRLAVHYMMRKGGLRLAVPSVLIHSPENIADLEKPVTVDLTDKSPLESLNLICDAFDVYFAYDEPCKIISVGATEDELFHRSSHKEVDTEFDPFAKSE